MTNHNRLYVVNYIVIQVVIQDQIGKVKELWLSYTSRDNPEQALQ